jgi:hypothetical protein
MARHAALRDYFCDKDACAELVADEWHLDLSWPDSMERHVDPRLAEGLAWWDPHLTPSGMSLARRRDRHVLTALYDTWTIHSWSEWLSKNRSEATNGLIVLHVDDHRDLGSPRLFRMNGTYIDAITGRPTSLYDPDSIERAIMSGAIGMGSFFTLLLHELNNVTILHLCQPPKLKASQSFGLANILERDTLLAPEAQRPALRLRGDVDPANASTYFVTDNHEALIDALPDEKPILVHIDMDYFNNRFDGDSEWRLHADRHDQTLVHIVEEIQRLGRTLNDPRIKNRIVDVSIAYSPGFFPAEFWSDADTQLRPFL